MKGSWLGGIWLFSEDEQAAEVYDPRNPRQHARTCHVGCIPKGWEIA
jgi:hypothetical protein